MTCVCDANKRMSMSYSFRHLYEQDMLLADATVSVQQFDSRLRQLQRERIRVQVHMIL